MKLRVATIILCVFILALLLSIAGCIDSSEPSEPLPVSVAVIPEGKWELEGHKCQTVVDTFHSILPIDIPVHLTDYNSEKTGEEYDVNMCFSVLKHIFMEPPYVLDYVYLFNHSFGGNPLVYVRKVDDTPLLNFEQYKEAKPSEEEAEKVSNLVGLVMNESDTSSNKIRIDGTPEGFFEYVVLQIMGGQFYLFWHSNYNDTMIICEPAGVDKVIQALERYPIPMDFEQEARNIDFHPNIEVNDDEVTVSLVLFSKWRGFVRVDSVINREYPHRIIQIEEFELLEYYCGVTF
ncbi:hypothetical protein ACFLW1_00325 [Chloroflexota bacterium]